MGMSYSDLSLFGILRKVNKMGPYSMFKHLARKFNETTSLSDVNIFIKKWGHSNGRTNQLVIDCKQSQKDVLFLFNQSPQDNCASTILPHVKLLA